MLLQCVCYYALASTSFQRFSPAWCSYFSFELKIISLKSNTPFSTLSLSLSVGWRSLFICNGTSLFQVVQWFLSSEYVSCDTFAKMQTSNWLPSLEFYRILLKYLAYNLICSPFLSPFLPLLVSIYLRILLFTFESVILLVYQFEHLWLCVAVFGQRIMLFLCDVFNEPLCCDNVWCIASCVVWCTP